MLVKRVKRFFEKMAKRHNDKNKTQPNKCVANSEADQKQCATDEFDEWNYRSSRPQRPHRQKRICERQEVFARVFKRA